MPPTVVSVPPSKPGPALPSNWQATFLAYYREHGGLHRAAEAADVSHETVRRYREREPAFDQAIRDAREYHADLTEERLVASAERSDNPVGFIVRLKALRPEQYIEKHAVMNLTVSAELTAIDGAHLLSQMLTHLRPPTQTLLETGSRPPALAPASDDSAPPDASA